MKIRKTCVTFPIFHNYTVRVIMTSNIAQAMLKYPHLKSLVGDVQDGDGQDPCVIASSGHSCYMFLPLNASVQTIAHESWHAIKAIFGFIDISLDHECVAYHLGYLVQKVHSFVHKGE